MCRTICRNIILFPIDTNYQNASAFLLAFSRIGKTQQCTNYTVQLSDEAESHTWHKVV